MSYNTAGVRKLNSFAEAKRWYENTSPIARHHEKVRPLGIRRHHKMASIRMPDAGTVELCYYGNPLVTWRSDNTFSVNTPKHWSAYVPDHIHNFVPLSLGFGWASGRMILRVGNEHYAMERDTTYNFQMLDGKYFFLNAPTAHAIRLKRKPYAEMMKKILPFVDWFEIVNSIADTHKYPAVEETYANFRMENGIPPDLWYDDFRNKVQPKIHKDEKMTELYWQAWQECRNAGVLPFRGMRVHNHKYAEFHRPSCEMLYNWITDPSGHRWTEALYVIMKQQAVTKRYWHNPEDRQLTLDKRAMLGYLSALIKFLFRDEVFEKVRLDQGELPTKNNLNFYSEIEFTLGNIDIMSIVPNTNQGV